MTAVLRILISGREKLRVKFRPERADAIAAALLGSADDLRAAGRAVALLEAGNVAVIYPLSTMGRLNMADNQERKLMPALAGATAPTVPPKEFAAAISALQDAGYFEGELYISEVVNIVLIAAAKVRK